MKQEIWRNYPVGSKVELVERLLERGITHDPACAITRNRQPGRYCVRGCSAPGQGVMEVMALSKSKDNRAHAALEPSVTAS